MAGFVNKVVAATTPTQSKMRWKASLNNSRLVTALSNFETELTPFSDDDEYTCRSPALERREHRKPPTAAANVQRQKRKKDKNMTTVQETTTHSATQSPSIIVGPDMENMEAESAKHREHIVKTLKYEVMTEYNTKIRFHHFHKDDIKEFSERRQKHYKEALRQRQKWLNEAKK